jgi:hypothetical protein
LVAAGEVGLDGTVVVLDEPGRAVVLAVALLDVAVDELACGAAFVAGMAPLSAPGAPVLPAVVPPPLLQAAKHAAKTTDTHRGFLIMVPPFRNAPAATAARTGA